MKTYLFIHEAEANNKELVLKVEPLYCTDRNGNVLTINDKDYTPTKGDKLYFLPGVNIPRVKLKDLSLQHGIKTVRDIDQATHVFAGKNTRDKITSSKWFYTMETKGLRDILADPDLVMDDYYKDNLNQALEFYTEDIVILHYHTANELRNSELPSVKKYISSTISRSSNLFYSVDDEYVDLFPTICNLDVFHESKLLKHINGDDAATIDETMFLQISDMFKSSDSDNHVLAMEIMANSNYIDSLLYIEMLFEKYAYQMTQCHTKNHVNFKSLLSFLGKSKTYMNTDVDDIMKSLIDKGVLDIEKVNIIMKYYGEYIADRGGNDYFEVKTITLNEDTSKLLNTNYVHELIPDFIPEGSFEIPELHGNLIELNSEEDLCSDSAQEEEVTDQDIENAFTRIERNELKSELIALEEQSRAHESHDENNNQIKEEDDNGFEWF